jgi:pSer/pThr/pTyr-binding forkhead associated (FHA) protein
MDARAFLILQEPDGGERRYALSGGATTLGRWEDSDIPLNDREISRRHAQIRHEAGRFVLADLGSKNGTRVNGVAVERATPLTDGDEILLGTRLRLLFVDQDATLPTEGRNRGLRLEAVTRNVTFRGQPLDPPLAPNQFALLQLFLSKPGRVFTRDEIAAVCYPEAAGGVSDQAIDGIVRRTRARLAEIEPEVEVILAVRGHGFKLDPACL